MTRRRLVSWLLVLLVPVVGLTGCEPYTSMTDRIPSQARRAVALLPEAPRYAGMIDLETVMGQIDLFGEMDLVDSLRRADDSRLSTFLDATGMDPTTDLKTIYGATGPEKSFHAVVFADLTQDQMDRYLDRAPKGAVRGATYRDIPVYHLILRDQHADEDTLSMGFIRNGMIAVAMDAGRVESMIDRHQDQTGSFRSNESYMALVERVAHGSTAWLVGRDVLQTAMRGARDSSDTPSESEAGFQQLLSAWSDRMLGLSSASSALEGSAGGKVDQLKSRIREQAVSLTLTDEVLEGEAYLTMRDETSASHVVDVSKGAIAALRLSEKDIGGVAGDLLDEITIDRDGPVVHVQFAVDRERIQGTGQTGKSERAARQSNRSIHRANATLRRLEGITPDTPSV